MADCGKEVEFECRLAKVEERVKEGERRLTELSEEQKTLQSLATSMAVMMNRQDSMDKSLKDIKNSVNAIAEKPAKRWESVVEKIIGVIVGGIIGFILVRVGLG